MMVGTYKRVVLVPGSRKIYPIGASVTASR